MVCLHIDICDNHHGNYALLLWWYCFGCTRGCRRLIEHFQGMGYHRRTKLLIKLFYAIIYGMPLDESAIMYTCVTRGTCDMTRINST